jgi:hypothetical protein
MNNLLASSIEIGGICLYLTAIIGAISFPIWGYKIIENKFISKHKALKSNQHKYYRRNLGTNIIASVGTTTAGVFLIQILPLIFSIIGDLGAAFNINTLYGEHFNNAGTSEYIDSFYGLTAQLGEMLQTAAPMAAVGLGGYNLLNNISRGLPAIHD